MQPPEPPMVQSRRAEVMATWIASGREKGASTVGSGEFGLTRMERCGSLLVAALCVSV